MFSINDLSVNHAEVKKVLQDNDFETAAQQFAYDISHPDYQTLAGRALYAHIESQLIRPYSKAVLSSHFNKIIDPALVKFVLQNSDAINEIIREDYDSRDRYDWVAVRTLQQGYIKCYRDNDGKLIALEDARYAIMRMAIHLFKDTPNALRDIRRFYDYVSQGQITPASPTWFHAGTLHPQLKSCFLTRVDDNIESILENYRDTGLISKEGGGNGVHIAGLRHSKVRETGKSGGIVPWMRMWNEQARAIDQGGNRKGAFTFYLPCWHKDIQTFIDLRLPEGDQDIRTHHLNICIWPSDLFFRRVLAGKKWSLFDPHEAPGLDKCNGDEFERLYTRYENSDVKRIVVDAKTLMGQIVRNVIMSGEPFCMSADACNSCSNQGHMGNHTGSNLCTEIVEQTNEHEIAACTLGNLNLSAFVQIDTNTDEEYFDFEEFGEATRFLVRVLSRVTATNFAPVDRIKTSDRLHNPIGIGTMDFATVLHMFDLPWINADGSPNREALDLKEKIWACKYYNSLQESLQMAKENGAPYPTFRGSPLSQGHFQFDLWRERHSKMRKWGLPHFNAVEDICSRPIIQPIEWGVSNTWEELMSEIQKYGIAHSLLNSDQPTATQANIQGGIECFQPVTYLLYVKQLLAGDLMIWCKPFVHDLERLKLWGPHVVDFLKQNSGSAKGLTDMILAYHEAEGEAPLDAKTIDRLRFLERKYATAFEIPIMTQSDFSTVSGRYVCQSTSFSFHTPSPSMSDIFNMWMYRWMCGHKTIMYYCRTEPAIDPVKYTVQKKQFNHEPKIIEKNGKKITCTDEVCTMCE